MSGVVVEGGSAGVAGGGQLPAGRPALKWRRFIVPVAVIARVHGVSSSVTPGCLSPHMEPFPVDKSFYDIAASDLKELWDSDIEQGVCEVKASEEEWERWCPPKRHVVLHDRLISDALVTAPQDVPISSEHSYCTPQSPLLHNESEEDEECLSGGQVVCTSLDRTLSVVVVKTEPQSPSPSPPPKPPTPFIYADIKTENKGFGQSVLKPPAVVLTTKNHTLKRKHIVMQNIVKIEPSTSAANFSLPPTPPSSTSSDSEGNVSPLHPSSPTRRLFTTSNNTQTRQPIQTSLISSQPKGSTGTLLLTEEEKRTLLAEGYPIPSRLPLTKAEEKSLKKIRRKIKNKISAQESRRKKKEYMDALERKVQVLSSENSDFRKKISTLEDANSSLASQLTKLQAFIARSHSGINAKNLHN